MQFNQWLRRKDKLSMYYYYLQVCLVFVCTTLRVFKTEEKLRLIVDIVIIVFESF